MPDPEADFELARGLGPGEAPEARAALLAWLETAPEGVVELSPGAAPASPLALQLLAAAARARTCPDIRFGPAAQAALDALGTPQAMEAPRP